MTKKVVIITGFAFIFALVFIFILKPLFVGAVTRSFIQTNWSGGADTETTIDETHLTDWTKFYSKDDSINISTEGEIKLNLE